MQKKRGGKHQMFKEFIWNTFIDTGNLESYIFFKEIEERDKAAEQRNLAQAEVAPSVTDT